MVCKFSKLKYKTYQHSGTEVEFIKELSDEDVGFNQTLGVSLLYILDDVSKPLPLLLTTCHPNEENLN